jgi:hypothetical protein
LRLVPMLMHEEKCRDIRILCRKIANRPAGFGFGRAGVYTCAMPRPTGSKKLYRWRISRIRGSPAEFIGFVEAPDDETAIKKAIKELEITDAKKGERLVAQRVT